MQVLFWLSAIIFFSCVYTTMTSASEVPYKGQDKKDIKMKSKQTFIVSDFLMFEECWFILIPCVLFVCLISR